MFARTLLVVALALVLVAVSAHNTRRNIETKLAKLEAKFDKLASVDKTGSISDSRSHISVGVRQCDTTVKCDCNEDGQDWPADPAVKIGLLVQAPGKIPRFVDKSECEQYEAFLVGHRTFLRMPDETFENFAVEGSAEALAEYIEEENKAEEAAKEEMRQAVGKLLKRQGDAVKKGGRFSSVAKFWGDISGTFGYGGVSDEDTPGFNAPVSIADVISAQAGGEGATESLVASAGQSSEAWAGIFAATFAGEALGIFLDPIMSQFESEEQTICTKKLVMGDDHNPCAHNDNGQTELYHGLCYQPCEGEGFKAKQEAAMERYFTRKNTDKAVKYRDRRVEKTTVNKVEVTTYPLIDPKANYVKLTWEGQDATCYETRPELPERPAQDNQPALVKQEACKGKIRCNGRTRASYSRNWGTRPRADAVRGYYETFPYLPKIGDLKCYVKDAQGRNTQTLDTNAVVSFGHCYPRCAPRCVKHWFTKNSFIWKRPSRIGAYCIGASSCPIVENVQWRRCGIYCAKSTGSCLAHVARILAAAVTAAIKITALVMSAGASFVGDGIVTVGMSAVKVGALTLLKELLKKFYKHYLIPFINDYILGKHPEKAPNSHVMMERLIIPITQAKCLANPDKYGTTEKTCEMEPNPVTQPNQMMFVNKKNNGNLVMCADVACKCLTAARTIANLMDKSSREVVEPTTTDEVLDSAASIMWDFAKEFDPTGILNLASKLYAPMCEEAPEYSIPGKGSNDKLDAECFSSDGKSQTLRNFLAS